MTSYSLDEAKEIIKEALARLIIEDKLEDDEVNFEYTIASYIKDYFEQIGEIELEDVAVSHNPDDALYAYRIAVRVSKEYFISFSMSDKLHYNNVITISENKFLIDEKAHGDLLKLASLIVNNDAVFKGLQEIMKKIIDKDSRIEYEKE